MMKTNNFTTIQQRAIALLASGINYRQTCKLLNIQRKTLWTWRKNPLFLNAIELEKQSFVDDYRKELNELKRKAIKQLSDYLDNTDIEMSEKIAVCFDCLNLTKSIKVNYVSLD